YGQPSYELPFNAAAAAGGVGNTMSDQFSNLRPQLFDDAEQPQPIVGFAELESKWLTFDPGSALLFAGVDTRLGMAKLTVSGSKSAAGVYQAIPLPTVQGETKQLAFYTRCVCAEARPEEGADASINPAPWGLALADGLDANPSGSGLHIIGGVFARTVLAGDGSGVTVAGSYNTLVAYDGLATLETELLYGLPQWFRWRLRQTLTDAETQEFAVDAECDFSLNGFDWQTAGILSFSGNPFKSIALVVQGTSSAQLSMYTQAFVAAEQAFDDLSPLGLGNQQQLGAV